MLKHNGKSIIATLPRFQLPYNDIIIIQINDQRACKNYDMFTACKELVSTVGAVENRDDVTEGVRAHATFGGQTHCSNPT